MTSQKKQTAHQAAFKFFLKHGGSVHVPGGETLAQGKARCARAMAKAERDARAYGFTFEWSDDRSIESHYTCESCMCCDSDGNVLASIGCVDDADANYRRVIEAELACEAIAAWGKVRESEDAEAS